MWAGAILETCLLFKQNVVIHFTERWSLMNDTGTAVGGDEAGGDDAPSDVLAVSCGQCAFGITRLFVEVVEWWLVAAANKVGATTCFHTNQRALYFCGERI